MKKDVILHIDTSVMKEATVTLTIDGVAHQKHAESDAMKAQVLLPLIKEMVKEQNVSLKDITAIEIVTGPGSYTGLRVGVAVANALGTLLGVPINGKSSLATPTYS